VSCLLGGHAPDIFLVPVTLHPECENPGYCSNVVKSDNLLTETSRAQTTACKRKRAKQSSGSSSWPTLSCVTTSTVAKRKVTQTVSEPTVTVAAKRPRVMVEEDSVFGLDPDYIPDSNCDSSNSALSFVIPLSVAPLDITSNGMNMQPVGQTDMLLSDRNATGADAAPINGKADVHVVVIESPGGIGWSDKRYYCLFCEDDISFAKIKPHLISKHADESDVATMMLAGCAESQRLLLKIRNLGNHKHNCAVLREGKGSIVVAYRPRDVNASFNDYVPCTQCYSYYVKTQLWKHCQKRCVWKETDGSSEKRVIAKGILLLPVNRAVQGQTWTVLGHMRDDEVQRAAVGDLLILQLANKLTAKHYTDPDKHEHIRCKVREMGRLLVQLKEDHKIGSICEALDPTRFRQLVQSVRSVAGFNEETHSYTTPSLALKLGHSLKKCAVFLISEALQTASKQKEEQANAFIRLSEIEWSDQVSSNALRSLHDNKLNQPTILPLTQDIAKLSHHLASLADKATAELSNEASPERHPGAWMTLAEVTLTQLILFNRRRVGEVSKIKLVAFQNAIVGDIQSDMMNHLSEVEKRLCRMLTRMEVIGKCGNHVPILLTEAYKQAIHTLINKRSVCGILEDNNFIFARPGSINHLRGSDVMRKYAEECGAESPSTLRGTALRKHIATLSQVMNLKDNELDVIAQFMGHNIKVHREYYRLPSELLQTAKVAKILMAMETGQQQKLTGQTLDDLNINIEEGIFQLFLSRLLVIPLCI